MIKKQDKNGYDMQVMKKDKRMEMGSDKPDIKSMTLEELKEDMLAIGEKPFRAKQLYGKPRPWRRRKRSSS